MNCPNCQATIANGASFCGACGTKLGPAASPAPLQPAAAYVGAAASPAMATPGPGPSSAGPSSASSAIPGFDSQATTGFVNRLKGILLSPKTEWPVISAESTPSAALFATYVVPLAALAAIVTFIRMSVVGISVPFGDTIRTPVFAGLTQALVSCVLAIVGVAIVATIINVFALTFAGTRDTRRALQTAAYSLTAAFVGSVFGLLPMGTLLGLLAGLYGIYTLYLGLPVMMRSRPDKAVGYTATVVICTIILGLILGAVSAGLGISTGRFAGLHHNTDQEAADNVANTIGNMLGTDPKGKEGLSSALENMAKVGRQQEQQEKAAAASGSATAARDGAPAAAESSSAQQATPADNPQNAMAAAGGLMAALGGALGGPKKHAPVDFHQLEAMLPASIPGMTRQQATGASNQALGVKGTSAQATYRGADGATQEVKIADATGVSGLMEFANSMGVSENTESDTGYDKDASLNGRQVHEKYDRNSKHGEISTIVAKRFEVDVSGDNVSMADLEHSLQSIDLRALESMKDAGAQ